jgi:hypothetical protein
MQALGVPLRARTVANQNRSPEEVASLVGCPINVGGFVEHLKLDLSA